MLLSNLLPLPGKQHIDILIENEKILSISNHGYSEAISSQIPSITFNNAIVFPGLINSHDHLDFNLFPQLGNKTYSNYIEWGEDIHLNNSETINNVLKIPKQLRMQWGIYKNLLNGITTVINHGAKLPANDNLITVHQDTHSLHSVQLEKNWKLKLNSPFIKNRPFTIHIGEGTDKTAKEEIDTLIQWNLFNRELIGIHAVGMDEVQANKFKALVWCPDSNYFLLGKTAAIDKLKDRTKIIFGTDSTVSSNWNLWEHLRLARRQKMVTDNELFSMLTVIPAEVWAMPSGGSLTKGQCADIVIAKRKSNLSSLNAFFDLNPDDILMVIHKGSIRLYDESVLPQLSNQNIGLQNFYKVQLNDTCKYVSGNLPELLMSIKNYYPEVRMPVTIT